MSRLPDDSAGMRRSRASPLRTSHLRDPGGPQVHFAVESFMDELAFSLGQDPIEFRLKYVKDPRDIAVIKVEAKALKPITFADSDKIKVGDIVLAVDATDVDGQVTKVKFKLNGNEEFVEEFSNRLAKAIQTARF